MIVGGYVLHVYCDHLMHIGGINVGAGEYSDYQTGGAARAAAKKDGWLIDTRTNTAYCPRCVRVEKSAKRRWRESREADER